MSINLFRSYPPVSLHLGTEKQFVESVLKNEDWYRNLPAPWVGAPTQEDALRQVAAEGKRLLRHPVSEVVRGAVATASIMLTCSPGERCGVCADCRRVLQIASVKQDLTLISRTGHGLSIYQYAYVPAAGRVRLGGISNLSFLAVAAGVTGLA